MARPELKLTGAYRVKIPDSGRGIIGDLWLRKDIWTEEQALDLEALLQSTLELWCRVWGK